MLSDVVKYSKPLWVGMLLVQIEVSDFVEIPSQQVH